jgi:hypothetical protein
MHSESDSLDIGNIKDNIGNDPGGDTVRVCVGWIDWTELQTSELTVLHLLNASKSTDINNTYITQCTTSTNKLWKL